MKDDTRNFLPRSERHASLDLLDQVAATEEEREGVRRVLYAPLRTAADLRRACSRCESGLTHCTTPDACERAESATSKSWLARLLPSKALPATADAPPDPPRESGDTLRVLALLLWPLAVVALVAVAAMVPWGEAQSILLALLDFGSQL